MVGGRLFIGAGSRSGVGVGTGVGTGIGAGAGVGAGVSASASGVFQNLGFGGVDGGLVWDHNIELLGAHRVGW